MLKDYLNEDLIKAGLVSTSKESIIIELAHLISGIYKELPADVVASALSERERIDSTGLENGIAIPHAKVNGIDKILIAVGRSKSGINFNAHDNNPTHMFFVLLAPQNTSGEHIKLLARLTKILGTIGLKEKLLQVKDEKEIFKILIEADKKTR